MRTKECQEGGIFRYRSQAVAIEVSFPFNYEVVFDFIHFRFLPSKAKSIGNVLTNRQSAALRSMVFFSPL